MGDFCCNVNSFDEKTLKRLFEGLVPEIEAMFLQQGLEETVWIAGDALT
jgi:hypothetical protein